jgi:hypothetical protein
VLAAASLGADGTGFDTDGPVEGGLDYPLTIPKHLADRGVHALVFR